MKDIEIKKTGIVIIQWLRNSEQELGQELYNQLKHKENDREDFFVYLYKVSGRSEFIHTLDELVKTTAEGIMFTLHIVSHGCEEGLGPNITEFVGWKEFFYYTRQLNEIMHNTLLIVLSSCVGGGIITCIEPRKRAPYMAFIGNTRAVSFKDAQKGFSLFYENYFTPLELSESLKKLNSAIDFSERLSSGQEKIEFFVMTASSTFDEIFNPDRDPKFFESIVNKLLPPNNAIPQHLRIEKAKEIFRKEAEKLRPFFTFQE